MQLQPLVRGDYIVGRSRQCTSGGSLPDPAIRLECDENRIASCPSRAKRCHNDADAGSTGTDHSQSQLR